jgi:pimeloyl-ACP methyl ester carboxylesterase
MVGDSEWERFLGSEAEVEFAAVGEHRLRVIQLGEGEPLLLIHGYADSAYTWHRNVQALAEAGFRAVAYDLPGCGESALPDHFGFGVDEQAELALGLLDLLGIQRTHLMGASMGGGIGLHLAARHPDRLRRVVLAAPVCYHPPFRPFIHLLHVRPVGAVVGRLIGPWMAGLALLRQYGDPSRIEPRTLAQYRLPFRRPEYHAACVGMARGFWNDAFVDTVDRYGEIDLPLQLVWGQRDLMLPPRKYAWRLAAETGADLEIVPGAGHVLQQEQPDEFNAAVIGFLRGQGEE